MEFTVGSEAGSRLDSYLAARMTDFSRARIQKLIREQYVFLNGQPAKPRDPVAAGDVIVINPPEEVPDLPLPQEIPLKILYEDEELIVLDKVPEMVVHPAAGNPEGTLVNALLHHTGGKLSRLGGESRPGIVHRLDKDTSGCLVAAKTDLAYQALTAQFSNRRVTKRYLAVVQGEPSEPKGRIFTHIARHPVNRQKMAVVTPPQGKPALTDYQCLAHDTATHTTLVLCDLHTGRTHQIRVHLRHLGHPLLGDPIYAKPARQRAQPGRLMLHAWQLGFLHPASGEFVSFEAPIPPEFWPWLESSATFSP